MNQQTKDRIFTLLIILGIIIILLVGVFLIVYYFKFSQCPLPPESPYKIDLMKINLSIVTTNS